MQTTWVLSNLVCVASALSAARALLQGEELVNTTSQYIVTFAFGATMSLSIMFNKYPPPGISYSITMAAMTMIMALSHPESTAVWYLDGSIAVFRLVVSWQYQKRWHVAGWNIIYMCAAFYTIDRAQVTGEEWSLFFNAQAWYAMAVFGVASVARNTTEAEARGEAEKASLHGERSAFRNMLELVCDVVAPLDDGLRLMEETSRLSAMVTFRQKSSIKGMCIQDFMPDADDKTAFESCMASLAEEADEAHATMSRVLHSKLRDGLGNILSVELFCVLTCSILGNGYLVGIREFSDHAPAQMTSSRRVASCSGSPAGSASTSASSNRHNGVSTAQAGADAESEHSGTSVEQVQVATRFNPTSETGLQLALIRVMSRFEVRSRASCCPYHQRLRHIEKAVKTLRAVECLPGFDTSETLQCKNCGFLNRDVGAAGRADAKDETICFACQAEARPPPLSL